MTFVDVVGAAGEMPVMTAAVHGLRGNRRADVKRLVRGQAGLGGTFRLSFRGFATADTHHNASAAEVAGARQLDSIPYDGGVVVTRVGGVGYEAMWRVMFAAPSGGGDVGRP